MSFDRLARHYSWMEQVLAGDRLHRCRTAFLDAARDARSILLAGEGHGRFVAEICQMNPHAAITCVDASAQMNRVAEGRLRREGLDSGRVKFVSKPILEYLPSEPVDLLATHFFLDCFPAAELQRVVDHLARCLQPRGHWVLSDFQLPERGWQRIRARWVLGLAYAFFATCTALPARHLTAPQPMLQANGLVLLRRRELNFRLLYSELWQKQA